MPRLQRRTPPYTIHHVVARFVERRFHLDHPGARDDYLCRVAQAARQHDCVLLAYSLMSSHVHWLLLVAQLALGSLFRAIHGGFATRMNRVLEREGPLFAGRFKNIEFDPEVAPIGLAYIHNNEVRAGTITHPEESRWSSHRAFLGLQPAPAWLDVDRAMELCGFDNTRAGRVGFGGWVESRADIPRIPELVGEGRDTDRRLTMAELPGCAQLQSPRLDPSGGLQWPARTPPLSPRAVAWPGELAIALEVAGTLGPVPTARLRSPGRETDVVRARDAVLLAWRDGLGRPLIEAGAALGMSSSAASKARKRAWDNRDSIELAQRICSACWELVPG